MTQVEQVTQDMQYFIVPKQCTIWENIEQFVNGKFVQDALDYTIMYSNMLCSS